MATQVDVTELETKVKAMYREVARNPTGSFHFELGEQLAVRLGYDPARLAAIPAGAVESFAGVGYFFDLAEPAPGQTVVDLGSGSGMDVCYAAGLVGPGGRVIGVDFTPEQLRKACLLAAEAGLTQVEFVEGRIDDVPLPDGCADCVISNGVINLAPDKAAVFAEAARLLTPGGRLAIADIITERQLVDTIVGDADLWASCIGGATQRDSYQQAMQAAGFRAVQTKPNDYRFLSDRAIGASTRYGVRSVSILALRI